MTVCIAAACRSGEYTVTATDGSLTLGVESVDRALTKMYWISNADEAWQFLYAGETSEIDLILENVRQEIVGNPKAISREQVQKTVRMAYKKRLAEWTEDYVLAPYDMTMKEFKKEGRKIFGDDLAARLARDMSDTVASFKGELMVVGWGKTSRSVMIYGVNQSGAWSGSLTGLAAIGSGREVAMSALLLYRITRDSSLEDTIYAVAAAKFSAERCDGVGKNTTVCVSRKQNPKDKNDERKPFQFLESEEIDRLRKLWEKYGQPRIPTEGYDVMMKIAQRTSGGVGPGSIVKLLDGISRRKRQTTRSASQKSEDQR